MEQAISQTNPQAPRPLSPAQTTAFHEMHRAFLHTNPNSNMAGFIKEALELYTFVQKHQPDLLEQLSLIELLKQHPDFSIERFLQVVERDWLKKLNDKDMQTGFMWLFGTLFPLIKAHREKLEQQGQYLPAAIETLFYQICIKKDLPVAHYYHPTLRAYIETQAPTFADQENVKHSTINMILMMQREYRVLAETVHSKEPNGNQTLIPSDESSLEERFKLIIQERKSPQNEHRKGTLGRAIIEAMKLSARTERLANIARRNPDIDYWCMNSHLDEHWKNEVRTMKINNPEQTSMLNRESHPFRQLQSLLARDYTDETRSRFFNRLYQLPNTHNLKSLSDLGMQIMDFITRYNDFLKPCELGLFDISQSSEDQSHKEALTQVNLFLVLTYFATKMQNGTLSLESPTPANTTPH